MTSLLSLSGKVAAIAGATGGVGSATAALFAQMGCNIAAGYHRNEEGAQALIKGLDGSGHSVHQAVLEDSESLEAFARAAAQQHGKIDYLINAAGFTEPVAHSDLKGLSDALIDQVFANNWRGPFALVRAFEDALRASDDAVVVNISSIAGSTTNGSSIAYCGSKAGLDSMTRTLAKALAPDIRVLGVSPGVVETGFVPGRGQNFYDKVAQTIPLKRVGQPSDVANAILACVTLLGFSTGAIITTDGGRAL